MLTSIFRIIRHDRNEAHNESDRLESLLAIACDGSPEDCYDEPGGELPPTQPNPSGGRKPKPETQAKGGRALDRPVVSRIAEALFGLPCPVPTAA